ncbi:HET-domain-containing protein [Rhizodiscina lignyota]|uniref:HET-domain-containing protein n=1 Tax=Rhizodiscina lignyota TaxID=1504668 RepID=A0A9P4MA93_9PEZI|nr:HET-domain-containing protein [Rhizodiscina lignyota]
MRLLNSDTLELKEFTERDVPEYAILSHTWQDGEVSFQDMQNGNAKEKPGWQKIENFAKVARECGYAWLWVDTCSIDKSSSAELSEAINSMYRWYGNAVFCCAYLCDVSEQGFYEELDSRASDWDRGFDYAFRHSRWFTRGWTLQELIAPAKLDFYVSGKEGWSSLGSKESLQEKLNSITGIPKGVLVGKHHHRSFSVAQRMSWASRRETTRTEDMAYCLLGLFEVNMPLLYGEGERAFTRLQEEIIRVSDDQSIFAWTSLSKEEDARGLLARSPAEFRNAHESDRD